MFIEEAIELFPCKYVSSHPKINEGDLILVTHDNIEFLRQVLSTTNFRWRSGQRLTESPSFIPNIVMKISENNTCFYQIYRRELKKAINYIYVSL